MLGRAARRFAFIGACRNPYLRCVPLPSGSWLVIAVAVATAVGVSGCAAQGQRAGAVPAQTPVAPSGGTASADGADGAIPDPGGATSTAPAGRPNELGLVPVIMYHQIVPRPKGVYDITPRAFRAELERLARGGFVPVTAGDYAAGHLDIPAGRHAVVLTFDDSTRSQLTLDKHDRPMRGTAVAILLAVSARHPGFTPTATFFVNRDPFAEPGGARYLGWLRDHGFEVGNHTLDHVSLASVPPRQVRRQLAGDSRMIERATGSATVTTLALPFGIRPRDRTSMMQGSWRGTSYAFDAAFLVGAGPAGSPHSRQFDPRAVPRIRSQGRRGPQAWYGSTAWLRRLAARPGRLYTSDGDPGTISFPRGSAGRLRPGDTATARPY
jgi:peptidoglycan/xylan/chitin deacetylase (PgdA/CDA1 family)